MAQQNAASAQLRRQQKAAARAAAAAGDEAALMNPELLLDAASRVLRCACPHLSTCLHVRYAKT